MSEAPAGRIGTWQSLRAVAGSWRLGSVALLSFASGLPLGLVWIAVPAWMTQVGVNIKVVGLITLAQAPWSFKVLWAPLMDRYPAPLLGRKRGWVLLSQVALFGLGISLAVAARHPEQVGLIGLLCLAIAFASATQDIAYDAYTVEVLRQEEHGAAVGARTALYRAAMWVSGRLSITAAAWSSWPVVNLALAALNLPAAILTALAPEPETIPRPPQRLREALWDPFVGLLAQHRSLEILAFVVLFKLSDNLTQALTGPFLIQTGYNAVDVGVASGTVGLVAILVGTVFGGVLAQARGLGPALWISGFFQVFSNLGYAVVAEVGVDRPVMYAAQAFEYVCSGMGNGAFGVLLLRLTHKRFSATQYALLSSLFSLPRVLAGPVAGLAADAVGWRDFFILTVFAGIPGLVMLWRFAPWGVREPAFHVAVARQGPPMTRPALLAWAVAGGVVFWASGLLTMGVLGGLGGYRTRGALELGPHLRSVLGFGDWRTALGVLLVGLVGGLATAATLVARRGVR